MVLYFVLRKPHCHKAYSNNESNKLKLTVSVESLLLRASECLKVKTLKYIVNVENVYTDSSANSILKNDNQINIDIVTEIQKASWLHVSRSVYLNVRIELLIDIVIR